ncbi:hypothetical protein ACFUJR_25960 [Streptomyces sp. NPDC057271]|uniref:hypothetical protein n=1 Tax=unclassified Streptomyces TaxID=2593676 RepID=UPI003643515A
MKKGTVKARRVGTYLVGQDLLAYPQELEDDLRDCGLPADERAQVFTVAWEYVRCAVPEFTNWGRYLAFTRLTVLTTVAEYRGHLVDMRKCMTPGETVLGYNVPELLDTLFAGTGVHDEMAREYTSSVLFMAEKARDRQSVLWRRHAEAFALSPVDYLRLRDCDAQVRFFVASALACNNLVPTFSEEQYRAIADIGVTLYDAVAFYKHRAEGEIANLYAYCGQDIEFRKAAYRDHRSTLWVLETQWCRSVAGRCAVNVVKQLPLVHMSMRRYRYVEDGLTIGKPESDAVVAQARANVKLWYRKETEQGLIFPQRSWADDRDAMAAVSDLLYPGLEATLVRTVEEFCKRCVRHPIYGARGEAGMFGGVDVCDKCRQAWRAYVLSSGRRHAQALSLPYEELA